jgi:hypothetical protein
MRIKHHLDLCVPSIVSIQFFFLVFGCSIFLAWFLTVLKLFQPVIQISVQDKHNKSDVTLGNDRPEVTTVATLKIGLPSFVAENCLQKPIQHLHEALFVLPEVTDQIHVQKAFFLWVIIVDS